MQAANTKPTTARAATTVTTTTSGKKKTEKPSSAATVSTTTQAKEAAATKKAEAAKKDQLKKPPPGPRAPTPPPKGNPTGVMLALARLLELEASMEYAYTKHMLLVKRQEELEEQHKVLETLPVGIDAIKEDL